MKGLTRRFSSIFLALACLTGGACGKDSPAAPTTMDMSGTWAGTGSYPNAPFQLVLIQTGAQLRGSYSDRLDQSVSVTGTFTSPTFQVSVNFGDAGLILSGTLTSARRADGVMFTPSLGNQQFPFTMTR